MLLDVQINILPIRVHPYNASGINNTLKRINCAKKYILYNPSSVFTVTIFSKLGNHRHNSLLQKTGFLSGFF